MHSGIGTIVSRGMLTAVADFRSAARWTRIVVSERWPATLRAFLPFRLSEPMTRMFFALGSSATFGGRSFSSPSRLSTLTWLILPFSRW